MILRIRITQIANRRILIPRRIPICITPLSQGVTDRLIHSSARLQKLELI